MRLPSRPSSARFSAQHSQESETHKVWARELDPLNGLIRHARGVTLFAVGKSDDAIREWRSGLASEPGIYVGSMSWNFSICTSRWFGPQPRPNSIEVSS